MTDKPPDDIETRLSRLERTVEQLAASLHTKRATDTPPPSGDSILTLPQTTASPPLAESSLSSHPSQPAERSKAEAFLGGRVLLAVGAITLLLGVAFFIEYAFSNGWVGPSGRVAIGLLAGLALVVAGDHFYRKKQQHYAGVLTGLGGGILYLSLWGAGNAFHLISIPVSFGAMSLVTAGLTVLALYRNSEVTATFAMLGGFITPLLNITQNPAPLTLLTYVALLDAALAFLPINRRWPRIQSVAFLFTQFYLAGAANRTPVLSLATVLLFATLFFILFVWQPIRKAIASVALSAYKSVLLVSTTGAYYVCLHLELYQAHRHLLTAAVVALAAAFVVLAQRAKTNDRNLLAAIALALITGGVAITFSGATVIAIWAIEGALLCGIGLRFELWAVRLFGYLAFACALLAADAFPPSSGHPFLNDRFTVFVVIALSFFVAHVGFARKRPVRLGAFEQGLFIAFEPLGHLALLYALSNDIFAAAGNSQLAITLLWTFYAIGLFAYGIRRNVAIARWEGLALLLGAIVKAFAIDMEAVNPGIRIVSFLALGIVLLAIAYVYQRLAGGIKENS